MCDVTDAKFYVNHGWYHYWDEPVKNKVFLKEYVKGPFIKTVLIFSDPYLIDAKQVPRDDSFQIKTGIPDPWSEYVYCNYISKPSGNSLRQCTMFKEDINITDTLRKRYRLYLGQGIPDPCLIRPYINRPDFSNIEYALNKAKSVCSFNHPVLKKSRKKHCFCCEKKYLFECPDEAKETSEEFKCFCLNCHAQVVEDLIKSDVRETCTRVHYYDNASSSEELKCDTEDQQLEKNEHFAQPPPVMVTPDKRPTQIKKPNLDPLKRNEKEADCKSHVIAAREKPLRPQSSEKKFRICCCPYFKKPKPNKGKVPQSKPTKEALCKAPPQMTKTTAKEIQTESAKCSKEVQTNLKSYTLNKYLGVCECTSKCTLCNMLHCRRSNMICPSKHLQCFGNSGCCLISFIDSLEKDQNNAQNQKGRELNKECVRLKPNQKMYCCTFTPENSGCSIGPSNRPAREGRRKNQKKSSETATSNSFVYHCATPSMAYMMKNYLEKNFNSKQTLRLPDPPSCCYEFKPGGEKLTGFDFSSEFGNKKLKNGHTKKQPLCQTGATLKNTFKCDSTAHIPLEVKYLNVKGEESKTYGLLNGKSQRRGRRMRSANEKKFSGQKLNISERQTQNEPHKNNKTVEVQSKEISSQLQKINSKNKKVCFKSFNSKRLCMNHESHGRKQR